MTIRTKKLELIMRRTMKNIFFTFFNAFKLNCQKTASFIISVLFIFLCACAGTDNSQSRKNSTIDLDEIVKIKDISVAELETKLCRHPRRSREEDGFLLITYEYVKTMPHKSMFNPATGKFEFPTKTTELTVYADAHGQVNAMKLDGYLYKNIVLPRYGTIEQIKVRALLETEIEKRFSK